MNGTDYLKQFDYDLHGIVGIRLINATDADAAIVTRQIGPIQKPLNRQPDIIIRFVDQLATDHLRYLGVEDAGFTEDSFLVLRSKQKSRAKVRIPFDQIGRRCEIVCERGALAVPLLIAIVNLTVLSKGALPIHASAFIYNGKGVLVTGWAKGGKTETLLAFTSRGASYVGDEWVYVSGDGKHMFGIPEPIRIWKWHLEDLPGYWSQVGRGDRARLQGLNLLVKTIDRAVASRALSASAPVRALRRIRPLLKNQLYVQLKPHRLFGMNGSPVSGTPQKVLFVASQESPEITVSSVDPLEIAKRMVFSLQEERMEFLSYYLKFRFAFPDLRNELIDEAERLQVEALYRALAGKDAYEIYHPYPVSIPALFDGIAPFI
jgi:hypothetical protein